jgi:hypothetical protein
MSESVPADVRRHHPQGMRETRTAGGRDEAKWKSEQEKQRRDQAIANTTGLAVLSEAIGQKVRQEFSAKARAKKEPKPVDKPAIKAKKPA